MHLVNFATCSTSVRSHYCKDFKTTLSPWKLGRWIVVGKEWPYKYFGQVTPWARRRGRNFPMVFLGEKTTYHFGHFRFIDFHDGRHPTNSTESIIYYLQTNYMIIPQNDDNLLFHETVSECDRHEYFQCDLHTLAVVVVETVATVTVV